MSTIFAVSSGRPPAAIAVIRISGPGALAAAEALAGRLPPPRQTSLRLLRDGAGLELDRALVIPFSGPRSATGEDLVELHCHGSRAVVDAVSRVLSAMPAVQPAEPGEFTRRALANGRIDLAEAEGLADLLEAETEAQRIAAFGAAEGRISRRVNSWLSQVAELSARAEAMLDYSEEGDVDASDEEIGNIARQAQVLGQEISTAADGLPLERLRDGVRIVIAGPPNAGKSTLLNLLVERDAAIVPPVAGTTRDRIEAGVIRGGTAYALIDTAGLTATDDVVEAIGVTRAEQAIDQADVLLWLGDNHPPRSDAIWVQSRSDQPGRSKLLLGRAMMVSQDDQASVSRLWEIIASAADSLLPRADALPLRQRHRALCQQASEVLRVKTSDPLLLGEQLRIAGSVLAAITGVNATEAMLDALFTRFCLGK